jgi:hypothetical protein
MTATKEGSGMAVVPVAELARRICVAHHPHYATVAAVPCGTHLAEARNVYGLVDERGSATFREVVRARAAAGLDRYGPNRADLTPALRVAVEETTDIDGNLT